MIRYIASSALLLCAISATVLRAAPPDAGQLLRQQQSQNDRLPAQPTPGKDSQVVTEASPAAAPAGVTVQVKGFRFSGFGKMAAESELQALVAGSVGRQLGVADLQRVAEKVTGFLRNKGFLLARAYLPRQDVTAGTIEISVVQASAEGEVAIKRSAGVRIGDGYLRKVASAIKPGEALREGDLERALLLMNDIPGVVARATLAPGSAPGTTRVTINVSEKPLFTGSVWTDNQGNRYTGAWRGSGLVSVNDPFGIGDQIGVMFSGAAGLAQGRLSYSAPLGSRGLRFNVGYSAMRYKLREELASMDGKGTANTVNAGLSQPIFRRRNFNLNANLSGEYKALKDDAYGFNIRNKRVQSGTLGVSGDATDRLLGGGYTTWSASYTRGKLDLSRNASDYNSDQGRYVYNSAGNYFSFPAPRADGGYSRINVSGSRLQRVMSGTTLLASYYGQLASKNLDSSEKFNLGGPYGVRAYPVGEAPGDEGHLINVELREDLPWTSRWGSIQLFSFFDAGSVTLNKDVWRGAVTSEEGDNSYWLTGAGVGIGLSRPGVYSLRVSYARKIGDNPGRTSEVRDSGGNLLSGGTDTDGRSSDGRLWFMGQVSF